MGSDGDIIYLSLMMRANWIETGNPNRSMNDAIKFGERDIIKPLTPEQQEFVVRLRKLAIKALSMGDLR